PAALEAIQMADRALKVNKQQPLPYGNSGWAYNLLAAYKLDNHEDGRELAEQAIGRFKAMLAIDASFVSGYAELSRAYLRLAQHQRTRNQSPQASLDEGLQVVNKCYAIEKENVECMAVLAQLEAEEGEWEWQQGNPSLPAFDKALGLLQKV